MSRRASVRCPARQHGHPGRGAAQAPEPGPRPSVAQGALSGGVCPREARPVPVSSPAETWGSPGDAEGGAREQPSPLVSPSAGSGAARALPHGGTAQLPSAGRPSALRPLAAPGGAGGYPPAVPTAGCSGLSRRGERRGQRKHQPEPGPGAVPAAGPGGGAAAALAQPSASRAGPARKRGTVSLRRRRSPSRPLPAAVRRAGAVPAARGGRGRGPSVREGRRRGGCVLPPLAHPLARPCTVGWERGEEGTSRRRRRKRRRLRIAGKWGAERLQQHRGRAAAAAAAAGRHAAVSSQAPSASGSRAAPAAPS
ncbi:translation initiation factor IF-2-like [Aquila chrysaetos chrysaetos]|uniref:translation initiation factor IF-2-like n=1 Tax=Aquila chrysaetos chrysaetos TaxID=223781 RepID=UPI001B7D3114|nr:translation initiation factor IF-2-like [Aquila chrysaetos chrysaetos]